MQNSLLAIRKGLNPEKDITSYWRLVTLKSLLLLAIVVLFINAVLILNTAATAGYYPLVLAYTISMEIAYIWIFLIVRDYKHLRIGSALTITIGYLAVFTVPFLHPQGAIAPVYNHLPVLLVASYIFLGIRGAMVASITSILYLLLHIFEVYGLLGLSLQGDKTPYFFGMFRSRIVVLIFIWGFLYILDRIQKALHASINREKEKSGKIDQYRDLQKLASGLAHEINNPLAIAMGNIARIERTMPNILKPENKISHRSLEKATKSLQRIQMVVRSFLTIFDENRQELTPCAIKSVIDEAIKHNSLEGRISNQVPEDFVIPTNEDIFADIIKIISQNAVEAAKQQDVVWALHERRKLICIDQGDGFKELTFEEALRPFTTTFSLNEGRGLGLFKAKILCLKINCRLFYTRKNGKTIIGIDFEKSSADSSVQPKAN